MKYKNYFDVADSQVNNFSEKYTETLKQNNKLNNAERNSKILQVWTEQMEDIIGEICPILRAMEDYMDENEYDDDIEAYYERIKNACEILTSVI